MEMYAFEDARLCARIHIDMHIYIIYRQIHMHMCRATLQCLLDESGKFPYVIGLL